MFKVINKLYKKGRKLMPYMSIQLKQMVAISFITFVILIVSCSFLTFSNIQSLKATIRTHLIQTANILNSNNISHLMKDAKSNAKNNLSMLRSDPLILEATLYDKHDEFFASYIKDSQQAQRAIVKDGLFFHKDYVYLLQHIDVDSVHEGKLLLVRSLDDLHQLIKRQILICVLIFLIGLSLIFFLSVYLKLRITQPISKLANIATRIVKNKNYTEFISGNQKDEIGKLINSFNEMLSVVQTRESELKEQNEHLETIIDMRTSQLQHRANHDPLTQLPNRYLLIENINQAIANAKRHKNLAAVLLIDLDRFKIINDSLGHAVGDRLLQKISERLSSLIRSSDCISRLGGDEFVILLGDVLQKDDAGLVAEKVIETLTKPFTIENHQLLIGASIGISIYPEDGEDSRILLQHADISMYQSKASPNSSFEYFEKSMDTTHQRLLLERNIRDAFKEKKFHLHYQPKIDVQSHKIVGFEALIRWNDSILGIVPPSHFIPVADEMGLLNSISQWVIESACKQSKIWKDEGFGDINIAVNISANHLVSDDVYLLIKQSLENNQLSGKHLEVELTEDVFIGHTERNSEILTKIKSLGVNIAIDDFGTGYSSLSYLQHFPFDKIKLDTTFTQNINNSDISRGIVASAIHLAHSLNLQIIAEGVEDQIQFDFLKKNNCDTVQGYYFSEPLSAKDVTKLLRQQ